MDIAAGEVSVAAGLLDRGLGVDEAVGDLVEVGSGEVRRRPAPGMPAQKEAHVAARRVRVRFLERAEVAEDGTRELEGGLREARVVPFAHGEPLGDSVGDPHLQVREPFGAVAAAHGDHEQQLLFAGFRVRDVFARDSVGRDVGAVGLEHGGELVDYLAAVLVARRGRVLEPELGEQGLHIIGHAGIGLVVGRLGVRDSRENSRRARELVVVAVGVVKEPVVVPGEAHGRLVALGRDDARVCGGDVRAPGGFCRVTHGLDGGRLADDCVSAAREPESPAHDAGEHAGRDHEHGRDDEKDDERASPPLGARGSRGGEGTCARAFALGLGGAGLGPEARGRGLLVG